MIVPAAIPFQGHPLRDQGAVFSSQLPDAVIKGGLPVLHRQPGHDIQLLFDEGDRKDHIPHFDGGDGRHPGVDASQHHLDRAGVPRLLQFLHPVLGPVDDISGHGFFLPCSLVYSPSCSSAAIKYPGRVEVKDIVSPVPGWTKPMLRA